MAEKTRVRRTVDERIISIEQKIKFHKEKIDLLEKQKKKILIPVQKKKTKGDTLNEIYKAAKASGKSLDDVLAMIKN